jgi:GTP-binding protein HflX
MHLLAGADVLAADKLFASLDIRTRQWNIPDWGKCYSAPPSAPFEIPPHDLIESFKATL